MLFCRDGKNGHRVGGCIIDAYPPPLLYCSRLTCFGKASRNRSVGVRLGRGESLASVMASMTEVAEGVATGEERDKTVLPPS